MNEKSVDRRLLGKWTASSLARGFFFSALLLVKQNFNYLLCLKCIMLLHCRNNRGINSEQEINTVTAASPLLQGKGILYLLFCKPVPLCAQLLSGTSGGATTLYSSVGIEIFSHIYKCSVIYQSQLKPVH